MPVTGFHSVIERPDSVSRVIPPTAIISTTSAATANSQRAIARGVAGALFMRRPLRPGGTKRKPERSPGAVGACAMLHCYINAPA